MFFPAYLQTDRAPTSWIWYMLLAVLLLLLIFWWLNRRRDSPQEDRHETAVQAQREQPPDDLKRIEGIGPKVEKVLNGAGITTFEALSRANPEEVQQALNSSGLQMMRPEGWIEQAQLASRGDWEGVRRLQNEMKGGRKS